MAASFSSSPTCEPRWLRPEDVDAMEELIHSPGVEWQQTADDLRWIVHGGHGVDDGGDCSMAMAALGIFDPSGRKIVSMATLPVFAGGRRRRGGGGRYDGGGGGDDDDDDDEPWGWLAYVVTDPAFRRRGLAGRLVREILDSVAPRHRRLPVGLYGSASGAPLYEAVGFDDRGWAQLVRGSFSGRGTGGDGGGGKSSPSLRSASAGLNLVPARDALPEICALDEAVYGTGRDAYLARWAQSEEGALAGAGWALLDRDGAAVGYVLARQMHPAGVWIGPVVASSSSEAELLLNVVIAAIPEGCDVQMLLPAVGASFGAESHVELKSNEGLQLALRLGFTRLGGPSRIMVRGDSVPWIRRHCLAIAEGSARPFAATGYEFG